LPEKNKNDKQEYTKPRKAHDACPHCGHELSPWQQVLLTIDRALVCKNCWYRIILEISEDDVNPLPPKEKE
jgi:DNA-directed RNA polymerase subunit RPC12/RpoP